MLTDAIDNQALVSAIERFAHDHDTGRIALHQKKYQALLPANRPGSGQQYAFEVDLDKCTGCKACVTACHNENGLDEDETWRSVGRIHGGTSANPLVQHVTTACHHCAQPACMDGCPTLAYVKDEATGIVRHLEDQCFGCQYCILKCPYNVPQYNKKRGIVHKCDMCVGRLNDGQAPACVRACPNGAIRITLVERKDVMANYREYVKIPDAPRSDYTYPTTKYKSKRVYPANMESADFYAIEPGHSHLPLVFMLVLTQLSVGAFIAGFILNYCISLSARETLHFLHVPVAMGIGLLALAASVFHLGRPQLAFRAVLGFRKSWLSREIIVFGLFAALSAFYALCHWVEPLRRVLAGLMGRHDLFTALSVLVSAAGVAGILCSVMVYRDTRRPFWDNHMTTWKFLATAFILGAALIFLTSAISGMADPGMASDYVRSGLGGIFCKAISVLLAVKLLLEASIFLAGASGNMTFIRKTAVLMAGPLKKITLWRFACGLAGGVFLPALFLSVRHETGPCATFIFALLIFAGCLAGELLERLLFFKAVVPLKMPGD